MLLGITMSVAEGTLNSSQALLAAPTGIAEVASMLAKIATVSEMLKILLNFFIDL
jgi:hypothetical protein